MSVYICLYIIYIINIIVYNIYNAIHCNTLAYLVSKEEGLTIMPLYNGLGGKKRSTA